MKRLLPLALFYLLPINVFSADRIDLNEDVKSNMLKEKWTTSKVIETFGLPEAKAKTALNDGQWVYPKANVEGSQEDAKQQKVWIVFDSDKRVKEVHTSKTCWLS